MKNVIIFHTDQLRFDSLGCNGNKNAKTPYIDALAAEGFNFLRHMTANPVCMPSRASLMTGLYPSGHGVTSNGIPLWSRENGCEDASNSVSQRIYGINIPTKVPTIADAFKLRGYTTAAIGKLHLQSHLADDSYHMYESQAFWKHPEAIDCTDEYYGFEHVRFALGHGEAPCEYDGGHYGRWLHEHHPEVVEAVHASREERKLLDVDQGIYLSKVPSKYHHSSWIANEGVDYIENHKDSGKPFFMFLGFPDPHAPFCPPEDFAKDFLDLELPEMADRSEIDYELPIVTDRLDRNIKSKKAISDAYCYTQAMIALIDKSIGKVIDKLKELGIYDDTTIVFTADHGEMLGDFGGLGKSDLALAALTHIPFILKPAKGFDVSVDTDIPMSNVDVLPTLFAVSGLEVPIPVNGVNIFNEASAENTPMTTCFHARLGERNISIFDKEYRYSYYLDTKEAELYHKSDINELHNLADKPEYAGICEKLKVKLMQKHVESEIGIYNHYGLW